MTPGTACADAPVCANGVAAWLLAHTHGGAFTGMYFCGLNDDPHTCEQHLASLSSSTIPVRALIVVPKDMACAVQGIDVIEDSEGIVAHRFDARPGTFYLLHPDQHVCARWRAFDTAAVMAAVRRATCATNECI